MMTATNPLALFDSWFADARASEPNDPNAMTVATVDSDGMPSARMVLLKEHGPNGFTFYTNLTSRKGQELAANPQAALLFHWKSLRRQIRINGTVTQVEDATADTYFATRARDSQIGAWASDQSHRLDSRDYFLDRLAEMEARFKDRDVPRPPHWSGLRVAPKRFEFWQDREYRLHERRLFLPDEDGGGWSEGLLYP